jgi:hypothetical protein
MSTVTKPTIKELQTNDNVAGHTCLVCNLKYRFLEAKKRCETWHKLDESR